MLVTSPAKWGRLSRPPRKYSHVLQVNDLDGHLPLRHGVIPAAGTEAGRSKRQAGGRRQLAVVGGRWFEAEVARRRVLPHGFLHRAAAIGGLSSLPLSPLGCQQAHPLCTEPKEPLPISSRSSYCPGSGPLLMAMLLESGEASSRRGEMASDQNLHCLFQA